MKRFAVLPFVMFALACGETTTEPAMDGNGLLVANLEANPTSSGATFEFSEDGAPFGILWPADGYTCEVDLRNWSRARTHKSAEQYQMRGKDVQVEIKGGYGDLLGTGSARFFAPEDNFLDAFLGNTFLIHASAKVLDASGNLYQAVCHYEKRPGEPEYSFITVDPR